MAGIESFSGARGDLGALEGTAGLARRVLGKVLVQILLCGVACVGFYAFGWLLSAMTGGAGVSLHSAAGAAAVFYGLSALIMLAGGLLALCFGRAGG